MSSTPVSYQFPAVLMAGMPNCGKSVLSYLLSRQLAHLQISHYLLRTAPDGEGNWFMEGQPGVVRLLRDQHKKNMGYSAEFVAYMKATIENRLVPLLVDVGGLPRGEQFGIIRACTHAILLYKDEEGRTAWRNILQEHGVPLIAELRSSLEQPAIIHQMIPFIQGDITGLDRNHPQPDLTFGAVLDRVAGLFHMEEPRLEQIHLRQAQYQPVVERWLLRQIDSTRNPATGWQAGDLPQVVSGLPQPGQAISIYGRGPVWLAAMLGAHSVGAPATIYDVRLGWLPIPKVNDASTSAHLKVDLTHYAQFDWASITVPGSLIEDSALSCLPIPGTGGLVLSGKLPRWAYASLARWLAPAREWLAVHDLKSNQAIVIYSRQADLPVGAILPVPVQSTSS